MHANSQAIVVLGTRQSVIERLAPDLPLGTFTTPRAAVSQSQQSAPRRGIRDAMTLLGIAALACIAAAALILVGYLIKRPPFTPWVKLVLLFGLGVFPVGAALTGNIANYQVTQQREFCGSCHVMDPHANDAKDPQSQSLAAMHSRLPHFGEQSCYVCHADYGMFGTVTTKIGGMHHVWDFYTQDWNAPGHRLPQLYKPYDSQACLQCHVPMRPPAPLEHRVHQSVIEAGTVACASAGCHGPPHPTEPYGPRGAASASHSEAP